MFAESFQSIDLAESSSWLIPVVGVVCALSVFIIAQQLLARSEKHLSPPPPASVMQAAVAITYDPFAQGAFGEKRISFRRNGNPVPVVLSDEEATANVAHGWVINRSVGGMCLSLEADQDKPSVGTVFNVRTTNAPDTTPWVQVQVRNCRLDGKEYVLGCQFLKTPAWSVLLLFG